MRRSTQTFFLPMSREILAPLVLLFGCLERNDTVLQPDPSAPGSREDEVTASDDPQDQAARSSTDATTRSAVDAGTTMSAAPSRESSPQATAGTTASAAPTEAPAGTAEAAAERPESTETAASGGSAPSVDAGTTTAGSGADGVPETPAMTDPPAVATDPDCDFTGVWMARQQTVSEALGLGQTSNNWYFIEFSQSGTALTVVDSMDCGIEIRGSATVTISRATLEAALQYNRQVGRKGTLEKVDGKCALDVARFWSIRGAEEAGFVPNEARDSTDSIADVAKAKPLPTESMPDGAIDTEGDGELGIAFQASGVLEGVRNSVQRDWTRWFTEPGYEITPAVAWPEDVVVRADFDNEEVVLAASNSLLRTGSTPRATKHIITLRFLGRSRDEARAQAIIAADDVATCYAVQDALPAGQLEE